MSNNFVKYKKDLQSLEELGDQLLRDLHFRHQAATSKLSKDEEESRKKINGIFETAYQEWYTEAAATIRQLIPDRHQEFTELYKGTRNRKTINIETYHIQDWLNGVSSNLKKDSEEKHFNDLAAVTMRFNNQLQILKAAQRRFESSLFDILQLVQADLFDSELEAARELLKNGFIRAAGAISGVVLEKHLLQVSKNHSLAIRKEHPSISDLNDLLKSNGVLEIPTWRGIQRLGDLRNLCDHNKHREPTKEEVEELINGVERISKTIF